MTPRCSGVKMANPSPITHFTRRIPPHGDLKLLNNNFSIFNHVSASESGSKIEFSVLFIRGPVAGQLVVNSLLEITLRELDDFGLYSCTVRNISSDFSLQNSSETITFLYM